jgi:hypothetical protein
MTSKTHSPSYTTKFLSEDFVIDAINLVVNTNSLYKGFLKPDEYILFLEQDPETGTFEVGVAKDTQVGN